MFLESSNNNGRKYLRLVESEKVFDPAKNKKVTRKKILLNLGFLDKLDHGDPDFFEKLKKSFIAGRPLLKELEPFVKKGNTLETYDIRIVEGSQSCIGKPKSFANSLFEKILDDLDVSQFIRTYKTHYDISYDVWGYLKLMVFGRILNPCSKFATLKQNGNYYTPIVKNIDSNEFNIYDSLTFIYEHRNAIYNRINNTMTKKYGRTTNYLFYDVTNFFFETDSPDDDIVGPDGSVEHGLRKKGVSKENREQPIVQMSLIMDEQGFPISIEQFPGNTLDKDTVDKTLRNVPGQVAGSRYIFVGDKGFTRGKSIPFALSNNKGYIISKSYRQSDKSDKDWITDPNGYVVLNENFKYKSRIRMRKHQLEDGTTADVPEKTVVYWSKKYFDMQVKEKKAFYEIVRKILENPSGFRASSIKSKDVSKYLKDYFISKSTGEVLKTKDLVALLDLDKLKRDYDSLGYYAIVTSETKMDDLDIIDKYHELVKIEDEFRIMKSSLNARPIYLWTKEHILAHLDVCVLALMVIRMIQRQIKLAFPRSDYKLFYEGLSADRIIDALNKFNVEKLDDSYYRFNDLDDSDLQTILSAFGVSIPLKLFKLGELRQFKLNYKITT